jgi:hypothetical protein
MPRILPEKRKEYNQRYEAKLSPEAKKRRRDAQAASKRRLRQTSKQVEPQLTGGNPSEGRGFLPGISSSHQSTPGSSNNPPSPNDSMGVPEQSTAPLDDARHDLASCMLGTQVPREAKTVKWADGHITVLPTLIHDGRNVLVNDEQLVRKMAALPASKPGSTLVTHLNSAMPEDVLLSEIRNSLRDGKAVVVRAAAKPGPPNITFDFLKRYGIYSTTVVDMHGTCPD